MSDVDIRVKNIKKGDKLKKKPTKCLSKVLSHHVLPRGASMCIKYTCI